MRYIFLFIFVVLPLGLGIGGLVQAIRNADVGELPIAWWLFQSMAGLLLAGGLVCLLVASQRMSKSLLRPQPNESDEAKTARKEANKVIRQEQDAAWKSVFFALPVIGFALGVSTVLLSTSGLLAPKAGPDEAAVKPAEQTEPEKEEKEKQLASTKLVVEEKKEPPQRIEYVERAGQFGDTFGWVNALFSSLAFAGILYTLSLQRSELKLQRVEMRRARNEARKMADSTTRSALLSVLSSLWTHYNGIANRKDPHAHRHAAIRDDMVDMMRNVLFFALAESSNLTKSAASLAKEVEWANERIDQIVAAIPQNTSPDQQIKDHGQAALDIFRTKEQLVGRTAFHVPNGSETFTLIGELSTMVFPPETKAADGSGGCTKVDFDVWLAEIQGHLTELAAAFEPPAG